MRVWCWRCCVRASNRSDTNGNASSPNGQGKCSTAARGGSEHHDDDDDDGGGDTIVAMLVRLLSATTQPSTPPTYPRAWFPFRSATTSLHSRNKIAKTQPDQSIGNQQSNSGGWHKSATFDSRGLCVALLPLRLPHRSATVHTLCVIRGALTAHVDECSPLSWSFLWLLWRWRQR